MAELKKLTSVSIRSRKGEGQPKLVAVTAYDYTFAKLADELVDILLVGDSLGMVIQGESTTLGVTVDHMVYHTRAVAKGAQRAHVVADLPFMSYQASARDALRNAGRLLAEGGAEAVKLEGGVAIARTVEKLVDSGIPVMGHVGLTPQSFHAFGGFKIQGKTDAAREAILQDALALEDAGVYAVVLEGMPTEVARTISERLKIPTIGIGAGPFCDGQVLVSTDLLGLNPNFQPRFVKNYAHMGEKVKEALHRYAQEVQNGVFPDENNSF